MLLRLLNTGRIATRDDDVQPPNTAATQSLWISLVAFSANTVGSLAPSSWTGLTFLSRMPPSALICSAARFRASETVLSLMDITPLIELRKPSLTLSPAVSTQPFAAADVSPSEDLEPHPVMTSAADSTAALPATSLARDFT